MNRTWLVQAGHLSCSWSETEQRVVYNPRWMKESFDIPSGYLPPIPDFASHCPFCGAFWFQPDAARLESE
jgi:hypothetical protein